MSSNLLKMGYANFQEDETRVIDANERMARRIEELTASIERFEGAETAQDGQSADDGFREGLSAEQVQGLFIGEEPDAGTEDAQKLLADARQNSEEIVKQARSEAQQILEDAKAQIRTEREEALAEARQKGYREGASRAESEYAAKERELQERGKALEAEYDALVDSLEPRFIDAITDVYEQLFHVEFAPHRELLMYLIDAALRRIEGRDFLVHVSAEDYPYVSMEKKELLSALSSPSATLELVEDNTLRHNECMIETEGGIFDCGLGTQLAELKRKLRLLSYETAHET